MLNLNLFPSTSKNAGKLFSEEVMPDGSEFVGMYIVYTPTEIVSSGIISENKLKGSAMKLSVPKKYLEMVLKEIASVGFSNGHFIDINTGEELQSLIGRKIKGTLKRTYSYEPQGETHEPLQTREGELIYAKGGRFSKEQLPGFRKCFMKIGYDSTKEYFYTEWKRKNEEGKWELFNPRKEEPANKGFESVEDIINVSNADAVPF